MKAQAVACFLWPREIHNFVSTCTGRTTRCCSPIMDQTGTATQSPVLPPFLFLSNFRRSHFSYSGKCENESKFGSSFFKFQNLCLLTTVNALTQRIPFTASPEPSPMISKMFSKSPSSSISQHSWWPCTSKALTLIMQVRSRFCPSPTPTSLQSKSKIPGHS